MSNPMLDIIAESLIDSLISRALKDVKAQAAAEGIVIPAHYEEALEAGIASGVAHTLLFLQQMEQLKKGLTSQTEPATI